MRRASFRSGVVSSLNILILVSLGEFATAATSNSSNGILRPDGGEIHEENTKENFVVISLTESDETHWEDIDPNELVQVSTLHEVDQPVYFVGEWIDVRCIASRSIFSRGFQWRFKLDDGNETEVNAVAKAIGSTIEESEEEIAEEMSLKIFRPDITSVICSACVNKNGEEEVAQLIQNVLPITVKEPILPKFTEPENATLTFYINENNHSLLCEAEGYPTPDIMWLKNGEEYIDDLLMDRSFRNLSRSFLFFPKISLYDTNSIFTCNATNVKGTVLKYFTVNIEEEVKTAEDNDEIKITFIIAGVAVFIVMGLFATILWVFYLNRRDSKFGRFTKRDINEFFKGNAETIKKCGGDSVQKAFYHPYDKTFEIDPNDLSIDYKSAPLGSGEFGVVLRGDLQTKLGTQQVAVKTTKNSDLNQLKTLLTEIKFMMHVGRHENIIEFLGAVTQDLINRNLFVVVAYCQLGCLQSHLRQHRGAFFDEFAKSSAIHDQLSKSPSASSSSSSSVSSTSYVRLDYLIKTSDLIRWAYQIANALEYLDSKRIIHGDVALRNMVLDGNQIVKLTDFGLSRHVYKRNSSSHYVSRQKELPMPWRWMPPETLRDNVFTSDVWSYGVCLYELFTLGEIPYAGMDFNEKFLKQLDNGMRLTQPGYTNDEIYLVMRNCWRLKPRERPTFTILKELFMGATQPEMEI